MDKDISYVAFESVCARFERTIKRLWIAIIILTVFLVGTNCAWLWYTSQFDDVIITQENEDGYSRGYSREGSYRGRMYARRDSMGRYSGNDEITSQLEDLMRSAPDDRTRQKIQEIMSKM